MATKVPTIPTTARPTPPVASQESHEALLARIAQLEEEKAQLAQVARSAIRLQVSEKKAVSLYGLRRFPITYYADEWTKILALSGEITAFIEAHAAELSQGKGQ